MHRSSETIGEIASALEGATSPLAIAWADFAALISRLPSLLSLALE
jgi:hypothetical protein